MRLNSVKKFTNRNDVVIVGGGPSGLTLAVALGAAGFRVACIERTQRKGTKAVRRTDGRTTALSFGSMKILKACGLASRLMPQACPILDIRVADGASPLHLDFRSKEVGSDPFGWIIENHIFHGELLKKAAALRNVQLLTGAMQSIEADDDEARLKLEDGRTLTASLIVGADGRQSVSRKEMNVPTYGWKYDQTSIVCTIAHSKPQNNVAVEHFLPGGPLATLPMLKQRSSIVWTEKTDAAKTLMEMSDREFTESLQEKVEDWLGKIKLVGARFMYPLSLQHAERYTSKRFALIGDAAHGIHPIAGQGFNLGMGDIGVLVEELTRALHLGIDPGAADILRRYEKRRKFANGNMVLMTDALDRLFSNSIPPIEAIRRLGLGMVQQAWPLRRYFMRTAMGLGEDRNQTG